MRKSKDCLQIIVSQTVSRGTLGYRAVRIEDPRQTFNSYHIFLARLQWKFGLVMACN
jgi:hypothetical protein